MLVLSRKVGEAIKVGAVVIRVTEISSGRVRIGIEAPEDVRIERYGGKDEPKLDTKSISGA